MSRLLPYVIVCLGLLILSRALTFIFTSSEDSTKERVAIAQAAEEEISNVPPSKLEQEPNTTEEDAKEDNNLVETLKKEYTPLFTDQTCGIPPSEIDILKALSKRREQLVKKEEDLAFKETALKVMQKAINEKLTDMTTLHKELEVLLGQYKKKENEKIARLVKVYENMKPKDAAKIFQELNMRVLLDVAEHMKEARLAAILAEMRPQKATDLTVALAKRRSLSK